MRYSGLDGQVSGNLMQVVGLRQSFDSVVPKHAQRCLSLESVGYDFLISSEKSNIFICYPRILKKTSIKKQY